MVAPGRLHTMRVNPKLRPELHGCAGVTMGKWENETLLMSLGQGPRPYVERRHHLLAAEELPGSAFSEAETPPLGGTAPAADASCCPRSCIILSYSLDFS